MGLWMMGMTQGCAEIIPKGMGMMGITWGKCAGLNPLPRTIQGNDPGTTACPPCTG